MTIILTLMMTTCNKQPPNKQRNKLSENKFDLFLKSHTDCLLFYSPDSGIFTGFSVFIKFFFPHTSNELHSFSFCYRQIFLSYYFDVFFAVIPDGTSIEVASPEMRSHTELHIGYTAVVVYCFECGFSTLLLASTNQASIID